MLQVHGGGGGEAVGGGLEADGGVGAALDAGGAFAAVGEQAGVQVDARWADDLLAFRRQGQPRNGAAGANLAAAVAVFPAVVLIEAEPGREEAGKAASAQVGVDDPGECKMVYRLC